MNQHRWSGYPGAWCLDCGQEDQNEICVAEHNRLLECTHGHWMCDQHPPLGCDEHKNGPCYHAGEGLADPYRKAIIAAERCHWEVNSFAMGDEDGQCPNPGQLEWFRRKTDAVVNESYRCLEHSGWTNDAWENTGLTEERRRLIDVLRQIHQLILDDAYETGAFL
jgi:hypothetical protein